MHLLDPWDECKTGQTAALTFMDLLTEDNPNHVEDARALAEAIVIPSGNNNTHWDNAARNFAAVLLLYIALDPREEGHRDLVTLRELITLPWVLPAAYRGPARESMWDPKTPPKPGEPLKRDALSALLFSFVQNNLAGGTIRRGFMAMINRDEKERAGIISSLERDTAWIDSPNMTKVLRGKSLNLREAALGGGKYFVVLPAEYFTTHRGWLRLCVTAFAKSFRRYQPSPDLPQHKRWRHIVIDEFPSLGEMGSVVEDVAVARGYSVKYHLVAQDFPQLKGIYGDRWQSFINNSYQRIFAVNDMFTADNVSQILGETTVEALSTSTGKSRSEGHSSSLSTGTSSGSSSPGWFSKAQSTSSSGTSESHTSGYSHSTSWSETQSVAPAARRLRTADEVRRLSAHDQYLIFRGMHPAQCWRPPWWEVFPALKNQNFTLKELLGTVGREPADEAERERFEAWRREPLLMRPKPYTPPLADESLRRLSAPEPVPADWRASLGLAALGISLVSAWFGWWWLFLIAFPATVIALTAWALKLSRWRAEACALGLLAWGLLEGASGADYVLPYIWDYPNLSVLLVMLSAALVPFVTAVQADSFWSASTVGTYVSGLHGKTAAWLKARELPGALIAVAINAGTLLVVLLAVMLLAPDRQRDLAGQSLQREIEAMTVDEAAIRRNVMARLAQKPYPVDVNLKAPISEARATITLAHTDTLARIAKLTVPPAELETLKTRLMSLVTLASEGVAPALKDPVERAKSAAATTILAAAQPRLTQAIETEVRAIKPRLVAEARDQLTKTEDKNWGNAAYSIAQKAKTTLEERATDVGELAARAEVREHQTDIEAAAVGTATGELRFLVSRARLDLGAVVDAFERQVKTAAEDAQKKREREETKARQQDLVRRLRAAAEKVTERFPHVVLADGPDVAVRYLCERSKQGTSVGFWWVFMAIDVTLDSSVVVEDVEIISGKFGSVRFYGVDYHGGGQFMIRDPLDEMAIASVRSNTDDLRLHWRQKDGRTGDMAFTVDAKFRVLRFMEECRTTRAGVR